MNGPCKIGMCGNPIDAIRKLHVSDCGAYSGVTDTSIVSISVASVRAIDFGPCCSKNVVLKLPNRTVAWHMCDDAWHVSVCSPISIVMIAL